MDRGHLAEATNQGVVRSVASHSHRAARRDDDSCPTAYETPSLVALGDVVELVRGPRRYDTHDLSMRYW
jgi:hypothetical protein